MFYGEYLHKLDKKNRLIIPARFRESIAEMCIEKFYITRGLDECLFMFPENEWRSQENKFKGMSFTKEKARKFQRQFFGGAFEAVPDKQWRILVPDSLKEYAKLSKSIVIVGISNRIEIWDKNKWQEYSVISKQEYEEVAEGLIEEL